MSNLAEKPADSKLVRGGLLTISAVPKGLSGPGRATKASLHLVSSAGPHVDVGFLEDRKCAIQLARSFQTGWGFTAARPCALGLFYSYI